MTNKIALQDPNIIKASASKLEMARTARQAHCAFSSTLKADIVDSIKAHLFESFMAEQGLEKTEIIVDDMPVAIKLSDGGITGGVAIRYTGGSKGTDYEIMSVFIDSLTDLAITASKIGVQFFVKDDSFRVTANSARDLVMLLNQAIPNKKFKIKFTAEDDAYVSTPRA